MDGVAIGYGPLSVENGGIIYQTSASITNPTVDVSLKLADEYYLGRDYEKREAAYELKAPAKLNYTGGAFSIDYAYDGSRRNGNLRYSMSSGAVNTLIDNMVQDLTDEAVVRTPKSSTNINLTLESSGAGQEMRIGCTYNLAGFGAQNTNLTSNPKGRYIRRANGRYEIYTGSYYQEQELRDGSAQKYSANLTGNGGTNIGDYLRNTVLQDIANTTTVSLHVYDYPKATLTADEKLNSAMVTRWQTPFQRPHFIPPEQPEEPPKYLRIQCSSNTTDTIWIQKQKLSVYRLGLTNVGTLSEMQATGCIDTVSAALSKISSVRSLFGAEQNRLEHAYAINRNTHENTQSAESKIRDTDMAKEMIRFSNANILEQSGNSMLVQANQANNIVLSLLQ